MAKNAAKERVKRTTTVVEERGQVDPPANDELDLTDPEPALPEEMDAMDKLHELSGGNSAARYEIRRTLPAMEAGYCGTLTHEEMTMERIAEEWGAGSYTVRVRLPGGKFAGSTGVQIAPLPKSKQPPPVASQHAAPSNGMGEMIAAMQRNTDSQISMLSTLVKSLIERPLPTPPTPPPPPDTLAILATAKQLFAKNDSSGDLTMFMKGLEFGKELGGDGGTDFGTLLSKGIDGLKDLSAMNPAPQPQPQRRARPALAPPGTVPAREPAAEAAPIVQAGAPPMLQLLQWLKQQTVMLCHQASKGKDPGLYAELFLDNLPDGLTPETILAQLEAPDAIQKLAKLNANVLNFPEWFEQFRQECIAELTGGDDDETDDDGAGPIEAAPGVEIIGGGEGGSQ